MHIADEMIETDFLVIGSGIAGLTFALHAAAHGKVLIVTKREPAISSTAWAQGGIAAVFDESDSIASHVNDTLVVGDGLCHQDVVELYVSQARESILELVNHVGVQFDRQGDHFELGLEGGHSHRRILHHKDSTGAEIERALLLAVSRHENIRILENHTALDLLSMSKYGSSQSCFGCYVFDNASGRVLTCVARATVLATGGAGKVYLYTSNPDVATGDGIALAYRAGADIANMEFFQFHPTCLYHPESKSFLISEALRGEGGILRSISGDEFMPRYHPLGSLAPRDVVARAIDAEMKRTGDEHVMLDLTHLESSFLKDRFPSIYTRCLELGIDLTKVPVPVVPAAHYSCGGVLTDSSGATTIPHLYAIGETAMSGLHGACRLASNSLLEGLVMARAAAQHAVSQVIEKPQTIQPWRYTSKESQDEMGAVHYAWDEVRRTMWNYVGIVRTDKRLERASRRIEMIQEEIQNYYWDFVLTRDLLELRNIALVAKLVIDCAKARKESRGLHYNQDYPKKDERFLNDTIIRK